MRTPLLLIAIAAVALGPAAAASAKEISAVKVCGADGCHDVTDRATMAVTDGGPPTAWPDEATPFYRVKISVKGEDGETVAGSTSLEAGSGWILRVSAFSSSIVVLGGLPQVPSSNWIFSADGTHWNDQPGTVSPFSPLTLIFTR